MTDGTTLCPHCATRFRIAGTQLAAHGGMVRCGHCRQAFDARANYQPDEPSPQLDLLIEPAVAADDDAQTSAQPGHPDTPDVPAAPEQPDAADTSDTPVAPDTPDAQAAAAPLPDEADAPYRASAPEQANDTAQANDAEQTGNAEYAAMPPAAETAAPAADAVTTDADAASAAPPESAALAEADDSLDFSVHAAESETPPAPQPAALTQFESAQAAAPEAEPDAAPPGLAEPVRQTGENDILLADYPHAADEDLGETPPPPQRRAWPWVIGVCVMALALAAQSAYFFRVALAAHAPGLKPALQAYCNVLGCEIPLPSNAEQIGIESSSLNADADHANQVSLDALLRNRADYTQAFPALSLTLNDMQDRPLVNRIFLPADYLPPGEKMANGMAANRELAIELRMDTGELRPAGYRVELFYPR